MRTIGYVRCSTHEQADSGLGLESQAERIKAYCTLKGLHLADLITDAGVSGGKPLAQREGGQRLLSSVKDRRAGAIVMLKLDRMFRNAGDCLTTVEQWEKAGVALHVIDLGGNAIDTTSAAGRFMLVVLAGAAEMERNLTRERTRSALAVKRANGERVGAVSYGFDLDRSQCERHRSPDSPNESHPCRCRLVKNPSEQAVIAEIRSLRSNGLRLQQIARVLTSRGIPTKTGKSTRWTHQAVARILQRPHSPVVV